MGAKNTTFFKIKDGMGQLTAYEASRTAVSGGQ